MSINEAALKELLGHLVFSHTFKTFDAKEAAEKALHELVHDEAPEPVAPPTQAMGI